MARGVRTPSGRAEARPDRPEATGRRGRWRRRLVRLAALIGVAAVVVAGVRAAGWWPGLPGLPDPFAERTTDRSQPVLLESIQDLSRFTAASGNFQVVIDVQTNRRFIPDIVLNERTLFVAAGTVDAYVDFAGLTGDALVVDGDGDAVVIALPAPRLESPNIDHDRSYIFAQERGITNRIGELFGGDLNQQQQLLQLAETKIAEAARASELAGRAEENTRKILKGMLGPLGFSTVTVTFVSP